jgi:hypothetical protein
MRERGRSIIIISNAGPVTGFLKYRDAHSMSAVQPRRDLLRKGMKSFCLASARRAMGKQTHFFLSFSLLRRKLQHLEL